MITYLLYFFESDVEASWNTEYSVTVTPEYNSTYEIIVPVPFKFKTNSSLMLDRLSFISGSGNYEEIDTQYGKGLKIESNGPFELTNENTINSTFKKKGNIVYESNKEVYPLLYDFLSMQNNTITRPGDAFGDHDYWVYYSGIGNISVTIHAERKFSEHGWTEKESFIEGISHTGWHTIPGREIYVTD